MIAQERNTDTNTVEQDSKPEKSLMAQPMEKLEMLNGNTQWIRGDMRKNMDTIYDFLEKKFRDRFLGTGRVTYTYNIIAKHTGLDNHTVSNVCKIMAFLKKPVIRIHARRYIMKKGVKVYQGVELIRRIPSPEPEKEPKEADNSPIP